MELYFSPLACSLASRIAFYEAGADARYTEVDPKTKRTTNGTNYLAVYPLGLVPLLRLDDGSLLAENAAILQYIAGRFRDAKLAPADERGRAELQQWLCFIGTELHKALFIPLFDKELGDDAKARVRKKAQSRLDYLNAHLADREFLLDSFSVADAYLYTVLNWAASTQVDLSPWPAIVAFHKRMQARPSVARAFKEELALYKAEVTRHQAA